MAAESTGGPSGERRLLIILFSDLVGSTELSQKIDPEDYADILLEYQEACRRIVMTNGGGIANYPGDGILAQFGYPVAHEDDADRAVQTGVDICRAVELINKRAPSSMPMPIAVRVGIHAGLTVIVNPEGDERRDLALFGDTPNIASRVQSAASSGQVLLTDDVVGLLRQDLDLGDLGVPEMKGVERPIRVHLVIGPPPARTREVRSPLIGRGAELSQLRRHWEEACRGHGRGVELIGTAGVGKSRLVTELSREVSPQSWVELDASEMDAGSAFAGLVQLVNRTLSLHPLAEARARAQRLREFLVLHPRPGIAPEPLLSLLAGESPPVGQSAENAHYEIIELALHVLLAWAAEMGHAVVAIEDIHWLDPSSYEFVCRLVDAARTAFLLVVVTARPEGSGDRSTASVPGAEAIALQPLSTVDIAGVIRRTAGTELDETTIAAIADRAEGIPLFAEELARHMEGNSSDDLPVLLRASLLARLDRAPGRRSVAQLASVMGTRVAWDVLCAATASTLEATEAALDDLTQCGVLSPGVRHGEHRFRHALVRDAIDSSLLRRDRQRLHLAVARALEEIGVDADHPPEVLAHHLAEGGEPAAAARRFAASALDAARRGAYKESKSLSETGLGLVSGLDDPDLLSLELELTMTLGNAINVVDGYGTPGLHDLWKRAEELCVATDNAFEQSSAMNGQAVASMFAGNARMAVAESRRIISFGERRDDREALVRGYSTLALQSAFLGDVEITMDSAHAVIRRYQPSDFFDLTYGFGTDHGVISHCAAALVNTFAGKGPLARHHGDAAVSLSRELNSPTSLCLALVSVGLAEILWGATHASRTWLDEAIHVATSHGLAYYQGLAEMFAGGADALEGRPGAEERVLTAVTGLLTGGNGLGTSLGWWLTALAQESAGHVEAAVGTAQAALVETQASGEQGFDPELHRIALRGRIALGQLSSDEALRQAIGLADQAHGRGATLLALRLLRDRSAAELADPRCRALLRQLESLVEPIPH